MKMKASQLIVADNLYTSFGHVLYCFFDIVRGGIDASCCIDDKIYIEAKVPGVYGAEIDTVIGGKAAKIESLYF